VEYRRLGGSGVKVSRVSLGSWLTYGGSVAEERARACIHKAYELGINFFDTANAYMRGAAEEIVGRASRASSATPTSSRHEGVLPDGPNDCGLSRKHITEHSATHRSSASGSTMWTSPFTIRSRSVTNHVP
jgi:aryl-alcohol dehydrogenase-like predicted oxidoreductase